MISTTSKPAYVCTYHHEINVARAVARVDSFESAAWSMAVSTFHHDTWRQNYARVGVATFDSVVHCASAYGHC
jgi:hypothetical protein